MDDMASIGLEVDSSDVRTATGDLGRFAGAGDRAGGSASRAEGAFGGLGRGLAVAAAQALAAVASVALLVSTMNRFIDATVTNEKAQAQLAAAIASTGGAAGRSVTQLNEHAAALQKITNFGDEATNAMQGVLLTFTQIKGDQFDAATLATMNLATAMGTDLKAAALQVGKALNDPVLGMTALARSGIQFTDAQKDMVKEMVAANDVVGAQTLILAELEKQFGGSAEAARNTLGGALASLSNAFGDLFELSGPGAENLRAAIERLTTAVANPAFFAAVQSIGTAFFAAAEMGVRALTALSSAFSLVSENVDIFAIALGVLAASRITALVAGLYASVTAFIAYNGIAAIATMASTLLGIAMKAIPFVAAVAGLTLIYRALSSTVDFAQDAEDAFNGFNTATSSLARVTAGLERDYVSLEAAQRSVTDAVKTGSGIERDAAIQSVSGINARIIANENLRRDLALTQESQLNALRAAAAAEEDLFNTRTSLIAAAALLNEEEGARAKLFEVHAKLESDGVESIKEAYLGLLATQVAAGEVLTETQQKYLDGARAVAATKQQVDDAVAALKLLKVPAGLAPDLGTAAGEAAGLAKHLKAAGDALSDLEKVNASLGLDAIGLEAQNRALEAGNSLIDARTQGLIATKREELAAVLGSSESEVRAEATLQLQNYTNALNRNGAAQAINDALTKQYNDTISQTESAARDAEEAIAKKNRTLEDEREAIEKQISALEDAADPLRVYNRGMAELDNLKLKGLTDGAYTLAVRELAKEMNKSTTFAEGFADALVDGTVSAVEMGKQLGGVLVASIGSVSDAFADFAVRGFTDFKGFVANVLDSFKSMLAQMISLAVRNQIMIGLGVSGGSAAGGTAAAAAGGGGMITDIAGSVVSSLVSSSAVLGTIGSSFAAGVLGSFGIGAGLGTATASAAATAAAAASVAAGGASVGAVTSVSASAAAAASIGAIAGPLLAVVAVLYFGLRTRTKELDAGIMATVDGIDTLVQTFSVVKKTKLFGLSIKVRKSLSDADDATTNAITGIVRSLQVGVISSAAALGIAATTFDNFAHSMEISTKGLSEEAANQAIQDALLGMADAMAGMVNGLDEFALEGEGAATTLSRLAQSLIVVNTTMETLGLSVYDMSLAGGGAAAAFIALFGSLENFNEVSQSYYQNFFTDAERVARATEVLSAAMLDLGVDAFPSTLAAFRALVEEADAVGDSGLVASLMQLSPAFAEIRAGSDALGESLRALVNEDMFATGQDFARGLSRSTNSQLFTPRESDAELRAELRALNVSMERLVSTSEITASNTGRGADAGDDALAFQLEQSL
jgi:hypothetical protein